MGAAPSTDVKIDVAQLSDPGRDPNKQINEDSCGYAQTRFGHLCVLCDGMGGHYGGQEASRRAITTIFEQIDQAQPNMTPAQALKYSVEVAARRVYELGGPADNKVRPGSTVVAMLLHDDGLDVAHVGDSRAYVIRSGQIYPLTRDHSMVQAMIDAGFITEEQGIGHPDANKITRALGMKPEVDVELRPEPMELFAGDILLTASDGLTDLALAKDILGATRQALASGSIDHVCQQLVRMANDRGGHDNITVQIVRVVQTAQRRTRTGVTQNDLQTPGNTLNQQPLPMAGEGVPGADVAPMSVAPHSLGMQVQAHGADAGPTSIDRPRRERQETLPMQTAATAHDGTSVAAAAAGSQPIAHANAQPGQQVGGLHLPPVPPLINPALSQALEPPKGMSDYRLDGVGGLQLPPASTRYVGQQAPAAPHSVGHHPMSHVGMAGAQARPAVPTAAMVAPGFGPPPSWQSPPQQPAAAAGGHWQPPAGHSLAITSNDPGSRPSRVNEIDSMGGRTGGNVLFLALAISFVAAVVVLALVWIFILNG